MAAAPDLAYRPTIPDALRRACARWPDRDFIVTPTTRMTFADADRRSRALAKRMIASGMGKGSHVGIYFTYGDAWVITWLAASRIGALVMPLATTYRSHEVATVLRIGDIGTLVTAPTVLSTDVGALLERAAPGLAGAGDSTLYLPSLPSLRAVWMAGDVDRPWATVIEMTAGEAGKDVSDELLDALEREVVPADLAQVTYTSGSSAEPKGVVHTHGTVVRATAAFAESRPPVPSERYFCAFPFFWIGGTLVLGAALHVGATVLCVERFDPGAALDLVERERATAVMGWPTLLQAMRDHESFSHRALPDIAGLTKGPADVALNATPVPGIPAHRGMSETVGNINSVDHRVLDPDSNAARADMEEGELCVRGYGLMHGYYKQERHDVFDDDGWLHTGDRVFMHRGRPFFVGRYTEMVKVRGANVAPREVELYFEERFPEVLHAFVVGTPDEHGAEEVTAVLVAASDRIIDPAALCARACDEISRYKVPTRVEVWDAGEVPWLGSGKPDKRAMRKRFVDEAGAS